MAEAAPHQPSGSVSSAHAREAAISWLVQKLAILPGKAEKLYDAGITTPEAARTADEDRLKALGFSPDEVQNLKSGAPTGSVQSDDMLEKWLEIRAKTSRKKPKKPGLGGGTAIPAGNDDLFRRWVAGDDSAMASWLTPAEAKPEVAPEQKAPEPGKEVVAPEAPKPEAPVPEAPAPAKHEEEARPASAPAAPAPETHAAKEPEVQVDNVSEAFSIWVATVGAELQSSNQKLGEDFLKDANQYLTAHRQALTRIKQLEEAVSAVKKGSVATIKYVRSKETRLREEAVAAKEVELAALKDQLEKVKASGRDIGKPIQLDDRRAVPTSIAAMMDGVRAREKVLEAKEKEFKAREEELTLRKNEIEKQRIPLASQEEKIAAWEQELRIKEQQLKVQMVKVEATKNATQDTATLEKLRNLEDLEAEIGRKEAAMKARENYLQQRLDELQGKEREVVDAEVTRADKDFTAELAEPKARTGVSRLDDLLAGGLPIGCNVLINGSKHTGKEVLSRFLIAEGLKSAIPVVWVLTDADPSAIRDSMTAILAPYREYEKRGLVRYVDLYSMNLGNDKAEDYTVKFSLQEPGVLDKINQAVSEISQEFLKKSKYYRLVFQSISTITSYLDTPDTMRFLQPFAGRRLKERCVAYYLIDTGMHEEADIDILEHLMDGSINMKVEQNKTMLAVKGIEDNVESRSWINYTFNKSTFSMGSFSLELIR